MNRKKILLLQSAGQPYDPMLASVKRYFPQQHLLIKLSLELPEEAYAQVYGSSQSDRRATRTPKGSKPHIEGWTSFTPSAIYQTRHHIVTMSDVIYESQFADLLLVERNLLEVTLSYRDQLSMVSKVLTDAACPVMVLPDNQAPIKQLILSFDGKSRTFSLIKQFFQDFFPDHLSLPAVLLLFDSCVESADYETRLIEFLKPQCEHLVVHYVSANAQLKLSEVTKPNHCPLLLQRCYHNLPEYFTEQLISINKSTLCLN